MAVDAKKRKKKRVLVIVLFVIPLLIMSAIAYAAITDFLEAPGSVAIISGGEVHGGNTHYFFFRSGNLSTDGAPEEPESLVLGLGPVSLEGDFEVRLRGWPRRTSPYLFYRLDDGQWVSALAVNPDNLNEVFLTHGNRRRDEWEQVYAESFLGLLEPGEYMLEIIVSWGTSRHGREGQYVFRLTKQA